MRRLYQTLPILLFLMVSCNGFETSHLLDDVDSYIRQCPDSALATLKKVDQSVLTTKKLRARYSLLFAMALDKNYIDTTDVSVVMPAVQYYRKHGDPDDKLRAYFYLGRIYRNSMKLADAAVAYSKAEDYAMDSADELQKGLLYMNFSELYNQIHNVDKEEEYARKGLRSYRLAGDSSHVNIAIGCFALIQHTKHNWQVADSLYKVGIEKTMYDTLAEVALLSNYAKMKMIQTEPDPQGAICLLDRMVDEYKQPLSVIDYGVYAYASELLGDNSSCDAILEYLKSLDDDQKSVASSWMYQIFRHREDYKKALEYLVMAYSSDDNALDSLLMSPVSQRLQNYYENEAKDANRRVVIITVIALFIVVIIASVFAIILLFLRLKRIRECEISDRMLTLSEDTNRLLCEKNNKLMELNARYENERDTLRKSFVSIYKDKFTAIGELCRTFVESKDREDKKDLIYYRVENLIADISNDDKRHAKFEERINNDLNNIITHLKDDLGDLDKKDVRLLCYLIAGFDTSTIASVLNMTATNIYTKKSRFKDRIRHLDSEYRDDYLRML